MRILLIQAYLGRKEKPIFPLGLCCIAAEAIHDGHIVEIFDPNVAEKPYPDLADKIKSFQPELAGISLRNLDTTHQVRDAFSYYPGFKNTLKTVTISNSQVPVVVGGSGFSMYAEYIMKKNPEIHFGVYLEGEKTFSQLLKNLSHPEFVSGIYFWKNGQLQFTGQSSLLDFDELPSPNYDLVSLNPYLNLLDTIGIQTKRGCPLKCAYCNYPFLNGNKIRLREVSQVVAEIQYLAEAKGLKNFIFVDSVFNIPLTQAKNICKEMIRRKLKVTWMGWINERFLDLEFTQLARDAGCRELNFSPDAYSDRSLQLLQKNITVNLIQKAFALVKETPNLKASYNFFLNPPGQTWKDFIRLLLFFLRVRIFNWKKVSSFSFGNIRLAPHTEMWRRALQEGLITEQDHLISEDADRKDLMKYFYSNPSTKYLDTFFYLYDFARILKAGFSRGAKGIIKIFSRNKN